jgi:uncharacterized protein YecE (DUF72 family)
VTGLGNIRVGVGGWTYVPWRGPFYPPGLPHARELEYAGRQLTAIEINGTFYRRQTPASFAKWRDAVPDGFAFTVKAHRACVSRKALAEVGESVQWFVGQGLTELGDRLGPILWQLPAAKQFDAADMAAFLALLPQAQDGVALRHAIEPRHPSFGDPAFFALARQNGVAVVHAEAEKYPCFTQQTAGFSYARLQCAQEELATGYADAALDRWAAQAKDWAKGGRDVFLFFISGAKVRNPVAAQALIARL